VTLAETQELFAALLTNPAAVPAGRLEACFEGTPGLPAAERVGIYAGMYRWRLADALQETFPHLVRALGDQAFASLAEDYLQRNPSTHHDVGEIGRSLPDFLERFPDPERRDLGDLATLEWARHQLFFAPPAAVAPAGALAGLDPAACDRVALELSPALRLLPLGHAVVPLWRALEDGAPLPPVAPGPAAAAVWRSGVEVFHASLPPEEAEALQRAAAGGSLSAVCAAFCDAADPARAAFVALSSWEKEGWLVGVRAIEPV